MNHLNEDQLLKLTLQALDPEEEVGFQNHISACSECRERLQRISQDTDLIGSIQTKEQIDCALPLPKRSRSFNVLLKAAALLLVGFTAGLGASTLCQTECVNVIPYQSRISALKTVDQSYATCESVGAFVDPAYIQSGH